MTVPVTAQQARERWHAQTLNGGGDVPIEERGDCVRACITSILGLPITAIDNCHGGGWWDRLRGECYRHGYDLALIDTRYEPPMDAYWIATVPSLNLGTDPDGKQAEHCVVARGYTLIHDPALGRKYDHEAWAHAWNDNAVTAGWVLVPLDPAALASRLEQAEQARETLHHAEYAARVQESNGNEGDADAIRRDAISAFLGLGIGEALAPPAGLGGGQTT